MAHIDVNKLKNDVINSWDNDKHRTAEASRVHGQEHQHLMLIIERQPTADVVPRAEFEQLQHKYALAVAEREANVKGFTENLASAKTDAAREIFAKIERIIGDSRVGEYSKEFGFSVRSYYNGAMIVQELDKLKKKYTEGEQ